MSKDHDQYRNKDGGPAYPMQQAGLDGLPDSAAEWGMSLRDWFAGQAMMGLARSYAEGTVDDYLPKYVAQDAYRIADAMLAQREADDD